MLAYEPVFSQVHSVDIVDTRKTTQANILLYILISSVDRVELGRK